MEPGWFLEKFTRYRRTFSFIFIYVHKFETCPYFKQANSLLNVFENWVITFLIQTLGMDGKPIVIHCMVDFVFSKKGVF